MSQYNDQQRPGQPYPGAGQTGQGQYAPGQYAQGQPQGGYPGQAPAQGPGMGGMQPGMQYPNPYQGYYPQQQQPSRSLFSIPNDRFLKGLLIGAAATYLITNEQVQRTAIKGVVKTWSLLQGGVEEVKERFGDAAAEIHHGSQNKEG